MNKDDAKVERVTKVGEMIPSIYNWIEPDIQKKRADKLANVTKKGNTKGK